MVKERRGKKPRRFSNGAACPTSVRIPRRGDQGMNSGMREKSSVTRWAASATAGSLGA